MISPAEPAGRADVPTEPSPVDPAQIEPAQMLAAYDAQLRTQSEAAHALSVARQGPLWLITFRGGSGFVTYQDLAGATPREIARMVSESLDHFRADPEVIEVEWKTRGHDRAPGLQTALLTNGFVAEEAESIMLGLAQSLAAEISLPASVRLRRITEADDVWRMNAMQDEVFSSSPAPEGSRALIDRLTADDGLELWIAESGGEVISAGRLEPVAGTDFAGIWGGATRPEWRGRGIYRALTAARARSALRLGKRFINSDSTEFSRPILERSGLVKVSTTTPYRWRR
ncbi:GNAT family N-acetyltransferase [Arthrobacter russicus]|jgi:ribosomal protein S18 acetylase RimI-like enzyme|uniref:Ribosomal protein S18 acetylase RimI-like enzyme n=2 Tax=Arthrobacter russicus TaxID=172040 RepID=A0ABU1J6D6_9MICC|nr:ribosomal protein S18 acetylase RimI-like enzyme [Arthrobacter russicus]